MATEVKIPALGESISSGILAVWHVKSGDVVTAGQALFDLETDKITSEGTAEVAGKIKLIASEGDEVEVGAVIAEIDESAAGSKSAEPDASNSSNEDSGNSDQPSTEQQHETHPTSVRRLAAESGIDPKKVEGTGKSGRVTKGDMLTAIDKASQSDKSDSTKSEDSTPANKGPTSESAKSSTSNAQRSSRKKMTPLRRTIAQRLVQAQQTTAMLTTFNEVDMSAVIACRKNYQDAFVAKHGIKLGFMSFFTKAVVMSLQKHPAINAMIDGEEVVTNHYYDIGVAVSTPKGLMVPVVRDCDQKSFAQLENAVAAYAAKARDGKISFDDLQGGVFTITNGGIFGSMLSTPILNTPQSAILGMHTIQQRAVVVDGSVVARPMMYLALSYDHRIVDGSEAVTFLVDVKKAIEDPTRLLFDI